MGKTVAIVQSSYIPWKGYFDLINLTDEFILLDDVQYTKRDWRNRNRIKTQNGPTWLTIPVQVKGKYLQSLKETRISDPKWNVRHWKTITHHYSKAKFFDHYREFFEELYLGSEENFLSQTNYRFLTAVCELLGVTTNICWSFDYSIKEGRTIRLLDLCKQAGATEYLTGPTAKSYIDEKLFIESGINLKYMDYSGYPQYDQLFPPFEHRVSIIDLIFNEGPRTSLHMKTF